VTNNDVDKEISESVSDIYIFVIIRVSVSDGIGELFNLMVFKLALINSFSMTSGIGIDDGGDCTGSKSGSTGYGSEGTF